MISENSEDSGKTEKTGKTGKPEVSLHSPTVDQVLRDIMGASHEGLPPFQPEGFTILETVGEGGFGVVLRARDEKLQREVALKVLRPQQLLARDVTESFLGEARALAKVRHPNVLTIYSVLEEGAHAALVMEFLDGEPLSALLERQGPFGARESTQMGIELCQALAAVHHVGIVHRDVKTPNIMREKGGRIVLTDFGLGARLSSRGWVETGFVAGSPLFMAPEQVEGKATDPRTDLYGLGVVLYNLSTGKFPAVAKDLPGLFEKVRSGALTPLRDARPDLPKEFTRVVTKALAADPEERYQSAGEMEEALTSSLSTPKSVAPSTLTTALAEAPAGSVSRTRPLFDRRPLFVLAATAAVLIGLFVLYSGSTTFQVESATLFTLDAQGDLHPLAEGAAIAVGSELVLEFQADRDLHVYVLNEDRAGRRHLLFPMSESDLRNPLAGGRRHRLPGTLQALENGSLRTFDISWKVDTAGGEEQLFVVASTESIKELERLAISPQPASSGYPVVKEAGMSGLLRGIGGKAYRERKSIAAGNQRLKNFIEELSAGGGVTEKASAIWLRRITLRNPE